MALALAPHGVTPSQTRTVGAWHPAAAAATASTMRVTPGAAFSWPLGATAHGSHTGTVAEWQARTRRSLVCASLSPTYSATECQCHSPVLPSHLAVAICTASPILTTSTQAASSFAHPWVEVPMLLMHVLRLEEEQDLRKELDPSHDDIRSYLVH